MEGGSTCGICRELQEEGKAFHCMSNHTLCGPCTGIQGSKCRLLENHECRLCQKEFLDPQQAIDEVPPLLESFRLLKNAVGMTVAFCGVNKYHGISQVRAKYVCTDCEIYSCQKCLPNHGKTNDHIVGRHNICDVVPNRRRNSALCWECSRRKAVNFCLAEECNASLCEVCTGCHDDGHDVKELTLAQDVMVEYISRKEATVKNSLLYVEEKKLDMERERRGRSREMGGIRETINSLADDLIHVIEKQRQNLLEDLASKEKNMQIEYDVIQSKLSQEEQMKRHLKSVHDLIGDTSTIFDLTSAYVFLKSNEVTWRSCDVRGLTESHDDVHFKEIVYRSHGDIGQNLRNYNMLGNIQTHVGYKQTPIASSVVECDTDSGPVQIANIIIPKPNRVIVCDRGNMDVKSSRLHIVNGKHEIREFHMKSQHVSQLVYDKKRRRLLGGICNSRFSWFDEVWALSWDLFNEKQLCEIGERHAGLLLVANDNYAYVITAFHTDGSKELNNSNEDLRAHLHGTAHSGEVAQRSPLSRLSPIPRRGDHSPKPPSSPRPSGSGSASPNPPSSPALSRSQELLPGTLSRKLRLYQLGVPDSNPGQTNSSAQNSPRLGNSPLLQRRQRCVTCPADFLDSELQSLERKVDASLSEIMKRKWKGEIFVYDLDTFEKVSNATTDHCPHTAVATPTGELVMISRDGWMRVLTSSLEELRSVRIAGIRGHTEADFHAHSASVLAVNGRGQLVVGIQGTNATTEQKGGRINLYSLSGEFLRTLIDERSGLQHPTAASIDDHGKLYVADDNQEKGQLLVVFRPERVDLANHSLEHNDADEQAEAHAFVEKQVGY